ncbi:hypothetical protein K1B37_001009 [Vibrio parahaemolyticus]|nr:hypothetical protein [Vibrio parahaemolyticus]
MKFRPYTPEEDQVIFDFGQTLSLKEIGKILNRSRMSVSIRAKRIGANVDKHKPYSKDEDRLIRKHAATKTSNEIGKLINRTSGSVGSRARKIGVSLMKHGENHHRAVHSNDDVRLVRALVDDGELTHKQISEKMEISINTVKLISYDKTRTQDHI